MAYVLTTELGIRADALPAAEDAARALAVSARSDGTCEMMGLHRIAGAPTLLVYQRWQDKAAYDAFYAKPEAMLHLQQLGGLASGPPKIAELEDIL